MINGVTQLVMTKIDVLDTFSAIKISTSYKVGDKCIDYFPFDIVDQKMEPCLEVFSGWNQSLDEVSKYSELPKEATQYIESIEAKLGVGFSMISTGPERSKLIPRISP